jgi:hypothetical protein
MFRFGANGYTSTHHQAPRNIAAQSTGAQEQALRQNMIVCTHNTAWTSANINYATAHATAPRLPL